MGSIALRTLLSACVFIGILSPPISFGAVVTVSGYKIFVTGQSFVIKGVNYSPVPIGTNPGIDPYGDYFVPQFSNVWIPDIQKMRDAGVNAIKLYAGNPALNAGIPNTAGNWKQFLDALWNGGSRPIYVLMFSYIQGDVVLQGGAAYQQYVTDYTDLVKSTVTHPAVLGYTIGNEIYGGGYVADPNSAFWTNLGALIDSAHQAGLGQGQDPFLITATNDNPVSQRWPAIQGGESSGKLGNLDAWAINVYRGPDFGGSGNLVFTEYLQQMQAVGKVKPLVIGEWGTPHSSRPIGTYGGDGSSAAPIELDSIPESQMGPGQPYFGVKTALAYFTEEWTALKANVNAPAGQQVSVGGFVFSWVDEWWKGNDDNQHQGGPSQGFQGGAFAGGYWDEAWFGLSSAVPLSQYGGNTPIVRTFYDAYEAIKTLYTAAAVRPPAASSADVTAPTHDFQGRNRQVVRSRRHLLRGTAKDDMAVAAVYVTVGGKERVAYGTTRWSLLVNLKPGRNVFRARAVDASGNRSKISTKVVVLADH